MSVKSQKPHQAGSSLPKLVAKISAWVALVAGIIGLAAKVSQIIQKHNEVPLQQYYATLSGDCLKTYIDDGLIDSPDPDGKKLSARPVASVGFDSAVRASFKAIAEGKPRTIDESTFLVLKNVSRNEAKEIVVSGPEASGSATHIPPGAAIAISLRYASMTGENRHINLSKYEFVPERGGSKSVDIDLYDQSVARQVSPSNSCSVLGYVPIKKPSKKE